MNSDSEVEFDSSDDDLSSNVQHSKRPFTRPFVHLKKRLRGAPCKSKYEALKAAGRVRDLCFTKRYSNADIKGLLKSSFPSLAYAVAESRRIRGTELYRQQKTPSCTIELKSNFNPGLKSKVLVPI